MMQGIRAPGHERFARRDDARIGPTKHEPPGGKRMDRDTDLFVQAFWVKCRDVIRPVLDLVIDDVKAAGHVAHVSTQEYSPVKDHLPDIGPALTLTVHPNGEADEIRTLQFHGDVAKGDVEILGSGIKAHRYELAAIDGSVAKQAIADWVDPLLGDKA
jgi:hypothetical protein